MRYGLKIYHSDNFFRLRCKGLQVSKICASLATTLLDHIKGRRLDVFFELEDKIMSGITLDKSIMEVVNDPENGSSEDKMPLFIIYFLCSPQMSDAELEVVSAQARSVHSRTTGNAKFFAIKTCFSVKSLFFKLKVCFRI